MDNFIIAIDGTAASGKGTIASNLAKYYGLRYLDTGLNYRSVAYHMLKENINIVEKENILQLAQQLDFALSIHDNLYKDEISDLASKIATYGALREILVLKQREFAQNSPKGAVLDGRDIGTIVYPEAAVKFYIDADIETRARRRFQFLKQERESISFMDVFEQLASRDTRDKTRKNSPLTKASDAHIIDTTHLTIEESIGVAKNIIDPILNDTCKKNKKDVESLSKFEG